MTMSTDDFVSKAQSIHGCIYDYSHVDYINLTTKVSIICPEHGKFEITPDAHIRGHKCPECERLEMIARRKIANFFDKYGHEFPTSFVSIDFETLRGQPVSACSVGMVKYINGEIKDCYYSLIKPPKDYEGKKGEVITRIHGFTEDQFENEKTMIDILPEMEKFAANLPLVAHHATTEKLCIKDTASFYNLSTNLDKYILFDTEEISEVAEILEGLLISGTNSHTLDTVCCRFGVEEKEHHHALDDALVCGKLMMIFINKLAQFSSPKLPIKEILYTKQKEKRTKEKYRPEDKIQRTDLENVSDSHFKNKIVCVTGFEDADSQEYGHRLWELGAILREGTSGKTNILICGKTAGPNKLADAQKYGIEILTESELLQILNNL